MTKKEMKEMREEFERYILNDCTCEVCDRSFRAVSDALDAGTDRFVHRKCASQWDGVWLNYGLQSNGISNNKLELEGLR